jgi:cell division protein FtsW
MLKLRTLRMEEAPDGRTSAREGGASPSAIVLAIVFVGVLFGLTMLYSTSSGLGKGAQYFIKQSIWVVLGTIAGSFVYWFGYERLSKYSLIILILAVLGLTAALFFPEINGAKRWIRFHSLSAQPSEFAKFALVVYLSALLSREQRFLHSFAGVFPASIWCLLVLLLVFVGDDLGTTILLAATAASMFFVAGAAIRWLVLPQFVVAPLGVLFVMHNPERWSRLTSFMDPEKVCVGSGYQLWNSMLALGSGGWLGLGFSQSRMKEMYLPEAHTDFILSIVGEELGFVGLMFVILGYASLTLAGMWISCRAKDKKGALMAFGATTLLALQALINLGVVSGALPTKGMPAPFISYGGSNMLMALSCVGLLLSVDRGAFKRGEWDGATV